MYFGPKVYDGFVAMFSGEDVVPEPSDETQEATPQAQRRQSARQQQQQQRRRRAAAAAAPSAAAESPAWPGVSA